MPTTTTPRARPNWGTIAAGFSAACALAVSAYTAHLQHQQVKAQVWPVLSLSTNVTNDEVATFSFGMKNQGLGPAFVHWGRVTLDDNPIATWSALVAAIVPGSTVVNMMYSNLHDTVLGAGERVTVFAPEASDVARQVGLAAGRIAVTVCYCSVLDDCWVLDVGKAHTELTSVAACHAPDGAFKQ